MDTVEVLQITDYLLEQYGMPVDVTCKSFRKQVITGTDPEKDPIMYNGIRETITQEDFRKACREVLQVHVRFSNNEETCKAARGPSTPAIQAQRLLSTKTTPTS